ncbi:hypothetical protein DICVIV_01155 [Dictyocaulus viviparus]|uniref:Uncharacterized protein n=1 Tax=Dictyocaulus viviparus TaxID=29172 RepID=A0A0D8Y9Q8_DICVI|nr:hypothetical protein DICVIV_01155 [Dictyocaulus viviparus]
MLPNENFGVRIGNVPDSWVMRIDGMPAVGIVRSKQLDSYLSFDCRLRAFVLQFLILLLAMPNAHSLTYFVGTSVNRMRSPNLNQEEPFLSKDDKQTIVMFCGSALSNPINREKIKDPLELRRICGALIREFKRQRDFEKDKQPLI